MNYPKDFIKTKSVRFIIYLIAFMGCLLFSNKSNATHIIGGEMSYVCLGNNQFEITLTIYRDCIFGGSNTEFADSVSIGIFDDDDELVDLGSGYNLGELSMPFISSQNITNISSDSCLTINSAICIESGIYRDTVSLENAIGGYQLAYQRCCRNNAITNIVEPVNTGITIYSFISQEALSLCLSSPQFGELIPTVACINESFELDQSVTSLSAADSISYRFCTPLTGASITFTQPQPPANPPYNEVQWNLPNFSFANPLGGIPLTIDPNTGLL